MGTYPEEKYERSQDGTTVTRTYDNKWGLITTEVYALQSQSEVRYTCYCCSCPETGMSDIDCRNHGWNGERPCLDHNTPGTRDQDGNMPDSVQARREKNAL